jgi:hypothetical protein
VLLQQGSPAVEDKKETRAGGRRWSMVLWTWRRIKADLSSIPSGPGTRPGMRGWTRQGRRMIKWCQGGKGAGEASPFQRSWRPARHGSHQLRRRSRALHMDVSRADERSSIKSVRHAPDRVLLAVIHCPPTPRRQQPPPTSGM